MALDVNLDQAFADKMVERAIVECAQAQFAGDVRRMRLALLKGQCEYCGILAESLVRQIGEYLGQVDGTVKAVYRFEAPPDSSIPESDTATGIHFLVWAARRSAALTALAETLKAVLGTSQRKLGCAKARPACYSLDMEIVDDQDVQERRGLGLLIDSPSLRAEVVWRRPAEPRAAVAEAEGLASRERYVLPDSFDPDIIPESRLIDHALAIERMPPQDRATLEHHLTELKVTLIRRVISDQLNYINIAKEWFSVADVAAIYRRRIGFGRIGGKSAGMLLAGRILHEVAGEAIQKCVSVPDSFFLGSDLMYIFMAMNGLMHWNDQKYKPEDQIRADYPQIQKDFADGEFPPEIRLELLAMLDEIGRRPLIARSSSQLEDSLGTTFAGKYDSHFCPNQATPQENLEALTRAISQTYASTFKPDALLYRRSRGLQDYDERMAVLIQVVQGERWDHYYFPFASGVAFSRNLYRWAPQIRREAGFARLVWGLGTRAVERVGDDYPRLVALSHPTLQPDSSPEAIRHYSQQYVDLIDLEANRFRTLPIREALSPQYPPLRILAQVERDGYFSRLQSMISPSDVPRLAITFEELLSRTGFPSILSELLQILENHWHSGVDVEFTVHVPDALKAPSEVRISLLQCRPQPSLKTAYAVSLPANLASEDIIIASNFIVPQGYLPNIRHVIFVPPEAYFQLPTPLVRNQLGQLIGRLNAALGKKAFLCVGPGRWGTENVDLGVYVGYADVCNAGALVELSGKEVGPAPEPSLGTHFFQDLMEAQIYPVVVNLDREGTVFSREFFYNTPNRLPDRVEVPHDLAAALRVIDVTDFRPGHHLEVIMDDEKGRTVAFLAPDPESPLPLQTQQNAEERTPPPNPHL
jgi:hypothetical protein